jgi:hypothetical protein
MKFSSRACILPFVLATLSMGPASAQTRDIFREISIEPYGSVGLGTAFSQADSLGQRIAPDVYVLPPGFGGTRGIAVVLDSDATVQALIFEYGPSETFDGLVDHYTAALGTPANTLVTNNTAQAPVDYLCTFWEDALTRFEVVLRPLGDSGELYSVMHDRDRPVGPDSCAIGLYFHSAGLLLRE